MNEYGTLVEWHSAENWSTHTKTCPSATLPTTNPTSSLGLRRHTDMRQNTLALARPCCRSIRSVYTEYKTTALHNSVKGICGMRNEPKLPKCVESESSIFIHKRPTSLNLSLATIQMKKGIWKEYFPFIHLNPVCVIWMGDEYDLEFASEYPAASLSLSRTS
jgi:hypothetical protein